MFELAEEEKQAQLRSMTMSTMLFCAFTMEAFLNHMGGLLFKSWPKLKKQLSPKAKLALIEEQLEIELDRDKRPFSTFKEIFKYRNWLVHGKTEEIPEPTVIKTKIGPDSEFKSKWQKRTTYENAKRFKEDTYRMMDKIYYVKRLESSGLETLGGGTYKSSEKTRLSGKE
jgi:hypothetical protein